ncbi:MAG: sulfite exporter TauE/SafE family protein [Stappiaceae bacterium]
MIIDLFSPEHLILFATAYFIAALVKGLTGLGFSTTALAILALFIGVKPALPLMLIPSLVSNVLVMVDAGHFYSVTRRFWPLYLATIPGVVIGLGTLSLISPTLAAAILGCVLIIYGLFALSKPGFALSGRLERRLAIPTGILTGIVNGMTGSQVMPVLPYLMALRLAPDQFVQAINISFSLCSLVMAAGLAGLGWITQEAVLISIFGLVPMFVGLKIGTVVRRRLSIGLFRTLVLCLLIIFGLLLIGKLI